MKKILNILAVIVVACFLFKFTTAFDPMTRAYETSYNAIKNLFFPDKKEWTEWEKSNIENFFKSRQTIQHEIDLLNKGADFSVSRHSLALNNALRYALLVREDVLFKANSELPQQYETYKKSLQISLEGYLESDNNKIMLGDQLFDQWIDWFNDNRHEIKIPQN
ncbi:MAG: hypothetical protein SVC26_08420 [Pseudomonadota bacterium]|nr:hypothetical protein [Pseudomonadota bacterium]